MVKIPEDIVSFDNNTTYLKLSCISLIVTHIYFKIDLVLNNVIVFKWRIIQKAHNEKVKVNRTYWKERMWLQKNHPPVCEW